MNHQFLTDLVSQTKGRKVRSILPFAIIGDSNDDFTVGTNFCYYGAFTIADAGTLDVSLNGATIALTATKTAITQPIFFDSVLCEKIAFVGYKIELE